LKLFAPTAAAFFLTGLGYYGYTFVTEHRALTNMSTLLFSAAVIIFLIGLISEQITNLTYRQDRHAVRFLQHGAFRACRTGNRLGTAPPLPDAA
jgi:predicted PurR-regulated permease PerM